MPNKKNKNQANNQSVNENLSASDFVVVAKDSAATSLRLAPALIIFVLKFIVLLLVLYFLGFMFIFMLPTLMVAIGHFFSLAYDAELIDIICVLVFPGVFMCLIEAGVWLVVAKVLWRKLIVTAFEKVKAAVA